jgi:hypothetical protein
MEGRRGERPARMGSSGAIRGARFLAGELMLAALASLAGPAATARADEEAVAAASEGYSPDYTVEIGAGYTARGDQQTGPGGVVETRGGTVTHGRLAASLYPGGGAFGVVLRAGADRFLLTDTSRAMPETFQASLLDTSAALALRTTGGGSLGAEATLGYSLLVSPMFAVTGDGRVSVRNIRDHGPMVGARASWDVLSWLGFDVRGRGVPVSLGASSGDTRLSGRYLEAGGGVRLGNLPAGRMRFAVVLDYGYGQTSLRGDAIDLKLNRHLLALGLRAWQGPRERPPLFGEMAGTSPEGPSDPGAAVAETPAPPPPRLDPPPPEVQEPLPPSHPASMRGTLWARSVAVVPGRAKRVPLPRATVTWRSAGAASSEVRSNARGEFSLEALPPGEGTLHVEAPGYEPVDKALTLAVGKREDLDLTLETMARQGKAIIRGTVRSAHGRKLKATLVIPEANLRNQLQRNGAFVFEVPPGRYTLKVSAHGYRTQSKSFELAGGEESIFSIEMRRKR